MNNTKSSMNREMNMKNKEKNDDFQMKSPNRPIFHMNNMKNSHVHEYFGNAYKDNIENKEYNLNSKDITSNYPYQMRNIDNIKNKEFSNSPSSYKPNQTTLKDRLSKEDDVEFNIKKIFDLIDDLNKKVDSSKEREELLNQKLIELKTDMERKNKMLNENKTEKEDKDRSIIEIKEDLVKMRKLFQFKKRKVITTTISRR
jgi:DNA-binding transcriptional MerR regulator